MTDYASCCILSYNRPQFLKECLGTLMAKAEAPLELIIHDDGSQDDELRRYLGQLQQQGMISSLILNPPGHNQGQGVALNRMFRLASGDPIIKLDQDLVFKDGWLAHVNYLLETNKHALDREPRIGLLALMHYLHEPVDSRKTVIGRHEGWSSHTHILGSAFAVTRRCWEELGPFDEHSEAFAEDWSFQQKVTASSGAHGGGNYVCALPDDDLVTNQGFGVGPSTVVVAPDTVATIHKGPKVFDQLEQLVVPE